ELVQQYDEGMFHAWKGELENLLIFNAGLFFATVTSFTIESCQRLEQASDDQSTQIVQPQPFSVSGSAIRINVFFLFLSLTLGMATFLIGIICMQWLREFKRDAARSHRNVIAIRQMRFEGSLEWKAPLVLLISLACFATPRSRSLLCGSPGIALGEELRRCNNGFGRFRSRDALPRWNGHLTRPPFIFLTTDLNLRVGQCPYNIASVFGLLSSILRNPSALSTHNHLEWENHPCFPSSRYSHDRGNRISGTISQTQRWIIAIRQTFCHPP
ncbi:hypothetical protein M413DRAFT_65719, partial [Hebeloma cylindrosporum]